LGKEGLEPTRDSRNTQPWQLRFRTLLTDGGIGRLEFMRAQEWTQAAMRC
jgi:hypothetical protein